MMNSIIKKTILFLIIIVLNTSLFSQTTDSIVIKKIYSAALTNDIAYNNLEYLCKKIGARIAGSPQAAAAVEWAKQLLQNMDIDNVYTEELWVHRWDRGEKEYCKLVSPLFGTQELTICALGESIGTGPTGINAEIIEVKNFDDLKKLGKKKIKGKIIFFNRPMDATLFNTFEAYGGAVDQRFSGASEAAKYGAIGVIVRSLTTNIDEFPHTGIMRYTEGTPKIPAVAVCTKDAELLSQWLQSDPKLKVYIKTNCQFYPEVKSCNVIGEIKGSKYPDEFIMVGGHIDSWDLGEGAQDDGVGCMQSIEVLRLFKSLGIKPKHSIRVVIFMDEEIAQRGGQKHKDLVELKNEKIIAAIESDGGGFIPTGFSIDASEEKILKLKEWIKLFENYGMHQVDVGWGGVDIDPLKELNIPLIGLETSSQRYFDYQHSAKDTFDKVNKREMQLGSAAMAALIYLIDQYGL